MKNPHMGSNFDDLLREENLFEAAEATAVNRVMAFQIAQEMDHRKGPQAGESESDED